jgi:hypothetical protein
MVNIQKFTKFLGVILLFIFLLGGPPAWAVITQPTVFLVSDKNGDGVAGVGDVISISCLSTTADTTGQFPEVVCQDLGVIMTLGQIAGTRYSALLTVSAGDVDGVNDVVGREVTFYFSDDTTSGTSMAKIQVDNRPPYSTTGPRIINTVKPSGKDGIYIIGDELNVEVDLTVDDGDTVYADLSAIGLSANYPFTAKSALNHALKRRVPVGWEETGLMIPVTAIDNAGNVKTWKNISIDIDTIAPEITSVTAVNMTAGKRYVTVGDAIRIQAVVANYDYDTVVVANEYLFGTQPVTMEKIEATVGGTAIFEYTHYVTEADIELVSTRFDVTVTDDAGNVTKKSSNYFNLATLDPLFSSLQIEIVKPQKSELPNTAIIDDVIRIYGNMSLTPDDTVMKDVTLTVNLMDIGGEANQIIPFKDYSTAPRVATTSFELLYTVPTYTSENNVPRAFVVQAYDRADNKVTRVTMPVHYVDNLPPKVSGAYVENTTSPSQTVKNGDKIRISAVVGNVDNGVVSADLSAIGGAAKETMRLQTTQGSNDTYVIDYTVTSDALGRGIDANLSFVVSAIDDAGNKRQDTTNTINIDTELPVIEVATFTVNPPLNNSDHAYVKVGDRLTFRVRMANSTAMVHDGEKVTIDLTALGGSAETELTYAGGWYTYTKIVSSGDLNFDEDFRVVAIDNANNAVYSNITVPIDNQVPVVGTMGVNFLTNKTSADYINVGDMLEFIIPVDDADLGSCHIDLSMIGLSSSVVLDYNSYDSTRKRYYITEECREAAMFNRSYVFTAIVYDKAGNSMNSLSQTFKVDCVPPAFRDTYVQVGNSTTKKITIGGQKYDMAVVGTDLTFSVEVDTSHSDYAPPYINLSKIGGSNRQVMNDVGDGLYSYTHRVSDGVTNGELLKFKVTLADEAGNEVYLYNEKSIYVDNYPTEIINISYTQSLDDNANGIVNLGARNGNNIIAATDTVTLTVEYSSPASLSVDLTKYGYSGYQDISETNNTTGIKSVTIMETPNGYRAEMVFEPRKGVTNGENVYANVRAVDPNGNVTTAASSNYLRVDNFPPRIQDLSIAIVQDAGNIGEANLNDIVQIKVTLYNHDDLEPFIDFTDLYRANGLTPPDWTIFPISTSNTYTYIWTIKEAFGTKSALTVIASDENGNKTVTNTREIVFLSKVPSFKYAYAELKSDITPVGAPNGIVNPGDTVKFTCAFNNLYTSNEDPYIPAKVLVDIRGIASSNTAATIGNPQYDVDGDSKAVWLELTRTPSSPMVYTGEYTAVAADTLNHGMDTENASFKFVVLHPTDYTISTAQEWGISKDNGEYFPIDTIKPNVVAGSYKLRVESSLYEEIKPYALKIGDNVTIEADIQSFDDPASATLVLYGRNTVGGVVPIYRTYMSKLPYTTTWYANFTVGTGTIELDGGDYNVWAKCDGATFVMQVIASDDADNLTQGVQKSLSPSYTIDNVPPKIINAQTKIEIIDVNDSGAAYKWVGNIADGLSTDTLKVSVAIDGLVRDSFAYVDMSSIGGTSTYMLTTTNNINFTTIDGTSLENGRVHYPLTYDVRTAELATHTLPIYVVDGSGNRAMVNDVYCQVALDTKRPRLLSAFYGDEMNASVLTLYFSERVDPKTFNYWDTVRIGNNADHKALVSNNYVQLDKNTDLPITGDEPTWEIKLKLGSATSGKIADWETSTLYISMAFDDSVSGESTPTGHKPIMRDEGGNWLVPIPRITTTRVTTIEDYKKRPNLVTGSYNGADPVLRNFLYLTFDKTIKYESITNLSLNQLAVWYNNGSSNETLLNRYRLNQDFLGDTYAIADQNAVPGINTVRIRLSEETKQWLAVTYGNRATQMRLTISDNPLIPPLIRDDLGNRVNEILPGNARVASFTPLTETFGLAATHLDFSDPANPTLTIRSDGRKIRVYQNGYTGSSLPLTLPLDLSGIILCSTDNLSTGKYMPLGTSTQTATKVVDWAKFKQLNTEFASSSIIIPLEADAIKTMLTWGTKNFYLHGNLGAFKDLWGNNSEAYPDQYNNRAELIPFIGPTSTGFADKPRIHSVAIMPISKDNTALFKGQPSGNLFYEVAFDTADLATDVKIPIDRSVQPNMYLYKQSDWVSMDKVLRAGASPVDTGAFVSWVDHNQGGVVRTAIRYSSSSGLLQDGTIDREPMIVYLGGFKDIFENATDPSDYSGYNVASMAYDLSKKKDSAAYTYGFDQTASYTMELDNQRPVAMTATTTNLLTGNTTNVIGVLGAGNLKVEVTFSEPMEPSSVPVLRLMNGSNVIMTFGRPVWKAANKAEFTSSSAFNSTTVQGLARYVVTGGYDEAGNLGVDKDLNDPSEMVTIKSRGPDIESITVTTLRATTANNTTDTVVGNYYGPRVSSDLGAGQDYVDENNDNIGIATITITFITQPEDDEGEVRIYPLSGGNPVATLVAKPKGSNWLATWDGKINGNAPIEERGQTTYQIRFYDKAGNEGSSRGTIIYDTFAPRVVTPWPFPNLRKDNTGRYYTNGTTKIEATLSVAEPVQLRLHSRSIGYQLYSMTNSAGTSYYYNFQGKDNNNTNLGEGEYYLAIVDMAGNLGVMSTDVTTFSKAALVIDRTAPVITGIKMYRKGKNLALDESRPNAVTSFNSNRNYMYIGISESGNSLDGALGYVKVMSGSVMVKELELMERPAADSDGTKLYAIWDGKDSNGNQVNDGTYKLVVCDLAGNEAAYSANNNVSVVKSVFKLEMVEQVGTKGIRLGFSHKIATNQVLTPVSYYFGIVGIAFAGGAAIDAENPNAIIATFVDEIDKSMHGQEYLLTVVPEQIASEEGDFVSAGYNTARFTLDLMGPQMLATPNYEGISSQRELNIVFDEQVVFALNTTSSPSLLPTNYVFTTSDNSVITVDSVAKGNDVKTVKLTLSGPLSDSVTYTLTASNITDVYGNKGTSTISFDGRDVTPPNITLTAFSNPANEFDITIMLGSDEPLGGDPVVTVAQSGSTAVSTSLKLVTSVAPGTYRYVYSGGVHLNSNYSGVATIKGTAYDVAGNRSEKTVYFTTAYVNSSVRASVESHDQRVKAVFEPGSLSADSMVMIMPESLLSAETNEPVASRRATLRGSMTAEASVVDRSIEELTPVASYGYNLVVPAKRLSGSIAMSYVGEKLSDEKGVGLYCDDGSGWKLVEHRLSEGAMVFDGKGGVYAQMRDIMAPRATMVNDLVSEPVRETRPMFVWKVEELGSGIDTQSAEVVLDGKRYTAMVDTNASTVSFLPDKPMVNGNHDIALRVSDKAGNEHLGESVRFAVLGSLTIHQVIQYPNPARNRVNIRFTTNDSTLSEDTVRIRIYDTAGHLVADHGNINMAGASKARAGMFDYDCRWDLTNRRGKTVANGVYFAKIEVRDPSDPSKKAKYTQKIAVLR